jgi:hypothetical protein
MYSYKQNKYELKKVKNLLNNKKKINKEITIKKEIIIKKEILNKYEYGIKSDIFNRNNFDWDGYLFDYTNLYLIPILEHFLYDGIKKIKWSFGRVTTTISRNGDLITNCYLKITLPEINKNLIDVINLEDKVLNDNSIDYYNLFIYSIDKLDIEKPDFFSNEMKQLYLWDKNFNSELINLPEKLQLLSICSEIFNKNITNLPDNLEYLYINSNCFNSNLTNLPNGLKVLSIVTSELTIKLDNLPR